MIKHYNDLVFSSITNEKDYFFKNPKFGKSNTDQSFFEPMASMIQNAQKLGSVSSSLHNDAEKSIEEIRNSSDFLPNYMTPEEVNAMIIQQKELTEQSINDVNKQFEQIKEEVKLKEEIVQNSSDSE